MAFQESVHGDHEFDKSDLGLNPGMTYSLDDIWGKRTITDTERFIFEIPADDVVFIRYKGPLDGTRAR